MRYGNIKFNTIEDGPGCRTALFVSGCRNHCPGCFQPETWNFAFGDEFTNETMDTILKSMVPEYIKGLSVLGGEPFEPENQETVYDIVSHVKKFYPEKNIWIYSGYTFEILTDPKSPQHTDFTEKILSLCDVLVDGRFELEKKNLMLPFRGSENQRVLNLPESLKSQKAVLSEYNERKKLPT